LLDLLVCFEHVSANLHEKSKSVIRLSCRIERRRDILASAMRNRRGGLRGAPLQKLDLVNLVGKHCAEARSRQALSSDGAPMDHGACFDAWLPDWVDHGVILPPERMRD
jgi:hypothetical protein